MNLRRELEDMGYVTEVVCPGVIAFSYKIPVGRFMGTEITLALQGPQFPNIPPPGLLINIHLLPLKGGGVHPTGGIHARNYGGRNWQYWSRPYREWSKTDRSIKTYMAFVRLLFDFE